MSYTVNKPVTARGKVTFVSESETPNLWKIAATGACELVSVVITAGTSACTFRLVDAKPGAFTNLAQIPSYNLESGIGLSVESSNSFAYIPSQPTPFKNGLIIVIEQGENSNAECTVTLNGN